MVHYAEMYELETSLADQLQRRHPLAQATLPQSPESGHTVDSIVKVWLQPFRCQSRLL